MACAHHRDYRVPMGDVVPLRPRREPDRAEPLRPQRAPEQVEPLWREALGDQLRAERRERVERIVDVAGRAGMSPQYLSELERGLKEPSSELLAAVASALDLTVAELTRRTSSRLASAGAISGPVCLAA